MNVLSLFDGISCAKVALERLNIPVLSYCAYEIDNSAIAVSKANHPTIKHNGDVKTLLTAIPVDLLIGGSPCQDLSIAKKGREGLEGQRSGLFWEYVRIKNLCNPRYFILENVASMSRADKDSITETLGVEPIMIDASLVSAQSRQRLFWTNIPTTLPEDRNITIQSILQPTVDDRYYIKDKVVEGVTEVKIGRDIGRRLKDGKRADNDKTIPISRRIELRPNNKSGTLTSVTKDNLVVSPTAVRRLTPVECERLQGLPDNYTSCISETQRYKCLGNAFNVDVIAHILSALEP